MDNRARIGVFVAVIGLLVIVVGSFLVFWNFRQNQLTTEVEPAEEVVTTSVVVTTHDLALGDLVMEQDVRLVEVPVEFVPRTAIGQADLVVGKIIKTDMVQGEMILEHNLADPTNVQGDIAFVLAEDHVLLAVPATDLISRHSVLQRGDIIDIYVSINQTVEVEDTTTLEDEEFTGLFTFDAFQGKPITAMVVEVIPQEEQQTQTQSDPDQPPPPAEERTLAYLIALDPQDALVLKHLIDSGARLDLVLRNPLSDEVFLLDPVNSQYIIERYRLEVLP